jgi:hypothetical protein
LTWTRSSAPLGPSASFHAGSFTSILERTLAPLLTEVSLACMRRWHASHPSHAQSSSKSRSSLPGLGGPRGLRFGPDGYLYVAEAGTAGTTSTVGQHPATALAPPLGRKTPKPSSWRSWSQARDGDSPSNWITRE